MAKRFTDTDKWKRPFFTDLSYKGKLSWVYLLDNCDHTGVWHVNLSLMSFQLGFKVTLKTLHEWFQDKIYLIEEDKVFLKSFIEFQYPELNSNNNAHKPVLKLLEKLGPLQDLKWGSLGPQVKDMVKVKVKEERSNFNFDLVYEEFPKKVGKKKGIEFCEKNIKTQDQYASLLGAVKRYAAHCRLERKDQKYIQHFSTFMNDWTDWDDPQAGKLVITRVVSNSVIAESKEDVFAKSIPDPSPLFSMSPEQLAELTKAFQPGLKRMPNDDGPKGAA